MDEKIVIGAMSGTSADGIDVAIVRIRGRGLSMSTELLHRQHRGYDDALRKSILVVREKGSSDLRSLASLARQITLEYAHLVCDAIVVANLKAEEITGVAAHGQTLFHDPPLTIQWLDPSLLALETACPVVSDFRRADCAVGGQGAPLVPFADYILFRHPQKHRILLNIGGIANLTNLAPGGSIDELIAFDTGPGNCISDRICRTSGPFGLSWDVDGGGASRGSVLQDVVEKVMGQPFFSAKPPKSTDGPAMIAAFQSAVGEAQVEMNDLLATAAYLTALSIATAIGQLRLNNDANVELLASGGGTCNKAIMGWLRSLLDPQVRISTSDELGIPSDAKEAIAFALLGAATLDGEASNVPSVTGARRKVILGSVTPRPSNLKSQI